MHTSFDFGSIEGLPAADFQDEKGNRSIRLKDGKVTYRGYTIVEKKDFGRQPFLISGFGVSHGYVVTDGGIVNEMPAGCWFLTVESAMRAIDDLIASRALPRTEPGGEHPFWSLNRFRRNTEERAPELALLLQELVEFVDRNFDDLRERDSIPDALADARQLLDRIDFNCDMRSTVHDVATGTRTKQGPRKTGRFGLPG